MTIDYLRYFLLILNLKNENSSILLTVSVILSMQKENQHFYKLLVY